MTTEAEHASALALDYRFGWRWLLPDCRQQKVVALGLTTEEQQWWGATMSLQFKGDSDLVDGCLISLDLCDAATVAEQLHARHPGWLCAWGSGAATDRLRQALGGFHLVREYALLPARSPRVLVPLSSGRRAAAGLSLHRPGRWLARLGVLAARRLVRLGYFALLRQRVLLVASIADDWPVGSLPVGLSTELGTGQPDFALYLGSNDDNRKTVVLPLGDTAPKMILKVADSAKARASLHNEAQALQALAATPVAACVPKLYGLTEAQGRLTLLQEYRPRSSVSRRSFNAAVMVFLGGLAKLEPYQIGLAVLLPLLPDHTRAKLPTRIEAAATQLRGHLAAIAERGVPIWLHRSHGDFAPWNCSWTAAGFFVFDWEASRARDLALADAFYFALSPFLHLEQCVDAESGLAKALKLAGEVAAQAGVPAIDPRLYLAIWLLQHLPESPFYGQLAIRLVRSWP